MFLDPFYVEDNGIVRISAEQASRFAKDIAGDYNPIHDPGAKRFCVPGDLLFCLAVSKYGLSQNMRFCFTGMVGDGVGLRFPVTEDEVFEVTDDAGKSYLRVERSGDRIVDPKLVESIALQYVAFSGRNFPQILAPLMAKHRVMINLERPLVIYESMALQFDRTDFSDPVLEIADAELEVAGKRGDATLEFRIDAGGERVGSGHKKLVLSGLREYDGDVLNVFLDEYNRRVAAARG